MSHEDGKKYTGDRAVILDYLPGKFSTLLDIGCSSGEFGAKVKKQSGAVVWGVEPVAATAKNATKVLDKVIHGYFDAESPIPDDFFDVVTFNDSLEHFPEPRTPLELARRKLKKNGVLICCVPNVRYVENVKNLLFGKDWKYTPMGILDDTHLRFFTERSLRRTIADARYEVTKVQGINPYFESGNKTRLLHPLLGSWAADMKYYQFVAVATPIND
ncbi:MAG: class I SAM-dependent methyltransferase [Burkholderiales bacterium]|nr:class I SAM-dependent methyltransferase [Burkholderiales bacterium]